MISQTPQVWLDCQVTDQFGGLEIGWDVRLGLFPEGQAEAMFDDFVGLLRRLAQSPRAWTYGDATEPVEAPPQALPGSARSIAAGFAERALLTPTPRRSTMPPAATATARSPSTPAPCAASWKRTARAVAGGSR